MDTDVVVIGSGATGMVAALTLAEGGARVVVLEKMRSLGGSSNFAEGMFAAESDLQKAQYIDYSCDQAFRNIMEYAHWRADARLVRAFVDETSGTIAWLQAHGIEFAEVTTNVPGAPHVWHVLKGGDRERASVMMKVLAARAKGLGVDVRLGTAAKSFIKEAGRITGVIAGDEENEIEIRAKAVVIGTGGFANNKEWIRKYTGYDLGVNLIPVGNVDKVGDGIRMAWEVGAAEQGLNVLQTLRAGPMSAPGIDAIGPVEGAAYQPCLHVNQEGRRYCDETISGNFPFDSNAIAKQNGKRVFTIFDDSLARQWIEKGVDISIGRIIPPGSRIDIYKPLAEAKKNNTPDIFEADSIDELAGKMGIEPAALKATVEEYNRFCEKGHDDLFAKDRRYLKPLVGPRFYALACRLVFLGTLGGLKINYRTEVLDKKDNPIPGLYAGGMDAAAGVHGDSYDVKTCGGTLAFAVNSGRIAGKSVLKFLGK